MNRALIYLLGLVPLASCPSGGLEPLQRTPVPTLRASDAPSPASSPTARAKPLAIDLASLSGEQRVGGERLYSKVVLPRFYQRRAGRPAWIVEGCPSPRGAELVRVLRRAADDGLRPVDYHVEIIASLLGEARAGRCSAARPMHRARARQLELLLSDAFLIFGSHLLGGRINPETLDPEWRARRRRADLAALLEQALVRGVAPVIDGLRSREPACGRLRQALRRYRRLAAAGGWKPLGGVSDSRPAVSGGVDLASLENRLAREGLLASTSSSPARDRLHIAVRTFQERHGLPPTAVVDERTRAELDVPVQARIRQLELNLERWRWLPARLGSRYVLVEIPTYELVAVDDGRVVLRARVVVGKLYRRTPMLSSMITTLVLNPVWQVPHRLAVRDVAKEVRKDPEYLRKKGFTIFDGWGPDAPVVDPRSIDWKKVTMRSFKYRLRQRPGRQNALGRIKFVFPNKYDVYLHDTPAKQLFAAQERTHSSGCIRVDKAMELAVWLLRGNRGWTPRRLRAAIAARHEQSILLGRPIPIYLTYFTAWVEPGGAVHFRPDIYGRDRRLAQALKRGPPRAASVPTR